MVINDFNFVSMTVTPSEADAPAIVDSDAVLPGPISPQGLQPIARDSRQVFQAGGCVEPSEPGASCCFDGQKPAASITLMERFSFPAAKGDNHSL